MSHRLVPVSMIYSLAICALIGMSSEVVTESLDQIRRGVDRDHLSEVLEC